MVNGKWLMGRTTPHLNPLPPEHRQRLLVRLDSPQGARRRAGGAAHREVRPPSGQNGRTAYTVRGYNSGSARAGPSTPLRASRSPDNVGRRPALRRSAATTGSGPLIPPIYVILQNEANFLECFNLWIGLRDKKLEVQVCHFVTWLRFAKIGFVCGVVAPLSSSREGLASMENALQTSQSGS